MVENKGIEKRLFDYIVRTINNAPYNIMMGMKAQKIGNGFVEIVLKCGKKHLSENYELDPVGTVHGGVMVSLADAIMGNAVRTLGNQVVTVDCSTKFITPVKLGDVIIGAGRVIKAGRKLIFTEAEMYVEKRLAATAHGTFYKIGDYNDIIADLE